MTKNEIVAQLKTEYPVLRKGSEETGYENLGEVEYNETISFWADNLISEQEIQTAITSAKEAAQAKLAALGLTADDLKALGLGGN